jgi:uncharacterized protein YciI
MFIITLTYKVELAEVEQHIQAHMAYIDQYYASGHFLASGRKVPRTGGVILAHGASKDEIDDIIKLDPFYTADVAIFEVTEFIPTRAASAIEAIKTYV